MYLEELKKRKRDVSNLIDEYCSKHKVDIDNIPKELSELLEEEYILDEDIQLLEDIL